MIKPENGRHVHYYNNTTQPLAAIICHVWSDRMVNLMVIDPGGTTRAVTSVQLLQDNDTAHGGMWAQWMPYQRQQEAKGAIDGRGVGIG